jgi:glycerol-3-phosphate dehydrogenase (NAD(P)+)
MKTTIIGAGLMGSAMAWPLRDNGHEVNLVGTHLDEEIIASCRKDGYHPKLKRKLPGGTRSFPFSLIDEALEDSELIVSGVNSMGVHWITDVLSSRVRKGQMIVGITKGLEVENADGGETRIRTFPEVIEAKFPAEVRGRIPVAAIGGPCIAGELAGRRPTCVVLGCRDIAAARALVKTFATSYYNLWPTAELLSLEVGVALKNAFTLGVGLAYGLLEKEGGPDAAGASMHNLASALFAEGTREIYQIIKVLGGVPDFAYVLPGAGDLYVTTMGGRTVRLGRLLGQGKSYEEAREIMKGETLESIEIVRAMARLLPHLQNRGLISGDDLPMLRMLIALIVEGRPLEIPLKKFFGGVFS